MTAPEYRPLNGDEKVNAIKSWLKKRWSDNFRESKTDEDQGADYYFHLGERGLIEDLQYYIDSVLDKAGVEKDYFKD